MADLPTVFISYSRADEPWKDRLVEHLKVLVRHGMLDVWDDSRIAAGADWKSEIERAIERASVAVLLITHRFLASEFVHHAEVPALLERRQNQGLRVIPVLVAPCAWKAVPWLAPMQLRLKNGQAISSCKEHEIDQDFAEITEEIRLQLAQQRQPERISDPAAIQPAREIRLDDLLRAHAPLPEPVAVPLAWRILAEIAGAHARGAALGCISARNIRLRRRGTELIPRIAKSASSAVESAVGEPPSLARDIHDFGYLLREMLHGQSAGSSRSPLRVSRAAEQAIHFSMSSGLDPDRASAVLMELLREIAVEPGLPAVTAPFNLGFEGEDRDGVPIGWFNSLGYVTGASNGYAVSVVDRDDQPRGRCALIQRTGSSPAEFGSLMQRCPAGYLAGKTIRLHGELRSERLTRWAGLWLRLDTRRHTTFFNNMSDRPVRGSTPWKLYTIQADDVDPEVEWLNFGVIVDGDGRVWVDDLSLLYLDPDGSWVPLDLE